MTNYVLDLQLFQNVRNIQVIVTNLNLEWIFGPELEARVMDFNKKFQGQKWITV